MGFQDCSGGKSKWGTDVSVKQSPYRTTQVSLFSLGKRAVLQVLFHS